MSFEVNAQEPFLETLQNPEISGAISQDYLDERRSAEISRKVAQREPELSQLAFNVSHETHDDPEQRRTFLDGAELQARKELKEEEAVELENIFKGPEAKHPPIIIKDKPHRRRILGFVAIQAISLMQLKRFRRGDAA